MRQHATPSTVTNIEHHPCPRHLNVACKRRLPTRAAKRLQVNIEMWGRGAQSKHTRPIERHGTQSCSTHSTCNISSAHCVGDPSNDGSARSLDRAGVVAGRGVYAWTPFGCAGSPVGAGPGEERRRRRTTTTMTTTTMMAMITPQRAQPFGRSVMQPASLVHIITVVTRAMGARPRAGPPESWGGRLANRWEARRSIARSTPCSALSCIKVGCT